MVQNSFKNIVSTSTKGTSHFFKVSDLTYFEGQSLSAAIIRWWKNSFFRNTTWSKQFSSLLLMQKNIKKMYVGVQLHVHVPKKHNRFLFDLHFTEVKVPSTAPLLVNGGTFRNSFSQISTIWYKSTPGWLLRRDNCGFVCLTVWPPGGGAIGPSKKYAFSPLSLAGPDFLSGFWFDLLLKVTEVKLVCWQQCR